jgi:hypothetical protein
MPRSARGDGLATLTLRWLAPFAQVGHAGDPARIQTNVYPGWSPRTRVLTLTATSGTSSAPKWLPETRPRKRVQFQEIPNSSAGRSRTHMKLEPAFRRLL